jgi:hypothetical protein
MSNWAFLSGANAQPVSLGRLWTIGMRVAKNCAYSPQSSIQIPTDEYLGPFKNLWIESIRFAESLPIPLQQIQLQQQELRGTRITGGSFIYHLRDDCRALADLRHSSVDSYLDRSLELLMDNRAETFGFLGAPIWISWASFLKAALSRRLSVTNFVERFPLFFVLSQPSPPANFN